MFLSRLLTVVDGSVVNAVEPLFSIYFSLSSLPVDLLTPPPPGGAKLELCLSARCIEGPRQRVNTVNTSTLGPCIPSVGPCWPLPSSGVSAVGGRGSLHLSRTASLMPQGNSI